MMAKGEPTEKREDRSTCAAMSVDACFCREKSESVAENIEGDGGGINLAGDGGGKECREGWLEEVAGRVAARAGGKHGGVSRRGRRYGGKAVAGK
jgi:hypothetical protein